MRVRALMAAILVAALHGSAMAAASCPRAGPGPLPPEAVPAARPEPGWQNRQAALDGEIASSNLTQIRLLFLGDSLTEAWPSIVFDHFYAQRGPLNLGVQGDTTQSMLWRLPRIPLGASLRPQLVVLLLGTNDLWPGAKPGDVAAAIGEVVHQIRDRSPRSRILLLGLLPRGESPDDPLRAVGSAINGMLARCTDAMVTFVDPGAMLLDGTGHLSKDYAFDSIHLTWVGYAVLSAALEPYIKQIVGG